MRLKVLQKMLWAAVALAIPAYGALHLLDERAETPVAEVSFRPTFSLLDAEGRVRMGGNFLVLALGRRL